MTGKILDDDTVQQDKAAALLARGEAILVVDDAALNGAGRGAFVHAAALATPELVNQTILHGRGLTCFSVTPAHAMRLGLMLAGAWRADLPGPLFLRSVEAATCTGTGISAEDRAQTLRAAGDRQATLTSLKSPGHVFPAMTGGGGMADLAQRALAALTGEEVAAWCDILDDAGEVADAAWCRALAETLGLPCLSAAQIAGFDARAEIREGVT